MSIGSQIRPAPADPDLPARIPNPEYMYVRIQAETQRDTTVMSRDAKLE